MSAYVLLYVQIVQTKITTVSFLLNDVWSMPSGFWPLAFVQKLPGTSSGESLTNGQGLLLSNWLEFMKTTCCLGCCL
jgi:hypothetical protein